MLQNDQLGNERHVCLRELCPARAAELATIGYPPRYQQGALHATAALALALGFLWQNGCLQQIAAKGLCYEKRRRRDSAARLC
jgi:hypothetical protein